MWRESVDFFDFSIPQCEGATEELKHYLLSFCMINLDAWTGMSSSSCSSCFFFFFFLRLSCQFFFFFRAQLWFLCSRQHTSTTTKLFSIMARRFIESNRLILWDVTLSMRTFKVSSIPTSSRHQLVRVGLQRGADTDGRPTGSWWRWHSGCSLFAPHCHPCPTARTTDACWIHRGRKQRRESAHFGARTVVGASSAHWRKDMHLRAVAGSNQGNGRKIFGRGSRSNVLAGLLEAEIGRRSSWHSRKIANACRFWQSVGSEQSASAWGASHSCLSIWLRPIGRSQGESDQQRWLRRISNFQ